MITVHYNYAFPKLFTYYWIENLTDITPGS